MSTLKHMSSSIIACAFLAIVVGGCSSQSTPVRQESFFTPVVRRVYAVKATAAPTAVISGSGVVTGSIPVRELEKALAESRREAYDLRIALMNVQDSLAMMRSIGVRHDVETRQLLDRIMALEQRMSIALQSRPRAPMPSIAQEAANEVPSTVPAMAAPSIKTNNSPAMIEYKQAVALFNQKAYDDARSAFGRLLDQGIQEDLADNCEYWIGESEFAVGHWADAIRSFERVIAMEGSNKRADAMLMMGRSFDHMRQYARGMAFYQRLVDEFPNAAATRSARLHLRKHRSGAHADPKRVMS